MRIIVCGCDGYIGKPLCHRLVKQGHSVIGIDNFFRRCAASDPVIQQIPSIYDMREYENFQFRAINISSNNAGYTKLISDFMPDIIINLAHQPSAPYSMQSEANARETLNNNIMGTHLTAWIVHKRCPWAHIITIGSTGEYDHYSNIPIEEGYFKITVDGRESNEMMYPRRPGSIYHASKTASTVLLDFYSRAWKLRITDIMQSIVFGLRTDEAGEDTLTRFDVDECFGTVLNRFIAQTVCGLPMTVYGMGDHKRGFIGLNDSLQGIMLAINNPPKIGDRPQVWNQLSETHSINELASIVRKEAIDLGIGARIAHVNTPRTEQTESHFYQYKTDVLQSLGYKPTIDIKEEIRFCLQYLSKHGQFSKNTIKELSDGPRIDWRSLS